MSWQAHLGPRIPPAKPGARFRCSDLVLVLKSADKYGFLDRWKTNPYRENPDKATEEKIWNGLWPSVLYSFPTEGLMLWAINYGRGEICYTCLPPLADIVIKVLITMWIADTTYFFLHWYEHQVGLRGKGSYREIK